MSARWSWARLRRGLLLFAAASPVTAILTYALILALPGLSSPASVALCVLFSGVRASFMTLSASASLPSCLEMRGAVALLGQGNSTYKYKPYQDCVCLMPQNGSRTEPQVASKQ